MKGSIWLDWILENRNATWQRGPWHAAHGMCLVGIQVREQGGFGIVDLAACASDGSPDEWSPWLTGNEGHDWERRGSRASEDYDFVGLEIREQPGFGIVDVRCIFRDGGVDQAGDWLTGNLEGDVHNSICEADRVITGIQIAEQAGFGIVNLRFRHSPTNRVQKVGSDLEIETPARTGLSV